MLPPGLLERLELVAELTPAGAAGGDATSGAGDGAADARATADLLGAARARPAPGPRPCRTRWPRRAAPPPAGARGGRAGQPRLDAAGCRCRATLRTLDPAARCGTRGGRGAGRRRVAPGPAARAAPGGAAGGARGGTGRGTARGRAGCPSRTDGRSPGSSDAASPRPRSASARAGRSRRDRPDGAAAGPPASDLLPAQAEAVDRIVAAIAARDPRPLLLDGVTGGGKTAIYVEAIAASLEAGRPALVLVPEIALALPLVDRLRADLDARVALVHSGLGEGERADEWRRIRAGDVDIVVGTRLAVRRAAGRRRGRSSSTRSTTPRTRATGRRGSRRATSRSGSAELAGAAIVLGSATPAVESVGRAQERRLRPHRPAVASGRRRTDGRGRRPARRARRRPARPAVARAGGGARRARHRGGRAGDPRPQPARHRVGRALPRLRPRPGLPGLRAAARLPPGRHDAALPPLRPGDPARLALPVVRLAADPLPRRRHGAGRARGPRHVPGPARRAARPRRRRAPRRRGARHRRLRRRAASTSSSGRAS